MRYRLYNYVAQGLSHNIMLLNGCGCHHHHLLTVAQSLSIRREVEGILWTSILRAMRNYN